MEGEEFFGEILVTPEEGTSNTCQSLILVPEIAIEEQGYIKTFTLKELAGAKHEYHALAQTAYFQYQDEELELEETSSPVAIKTPREAIIFAAGMVLYRTLEGEVAALFHRGQNRKKLLEAGYRFCTRWVRLDI